jgi:hypothetical protein
MLHVMDTSLNYRSGSSGRLVSTLSFPSFSAGEDSEEAAGLRTMIRKTPNPISSKEMACCEASLATVVRKTRAQQRKNSREAVRVVNDAVDTSGPDCS